MSLILSEINTTELSDLTAKKVVEQIKELYLEQPKREEFLTSKETAKLLRITLPTLTDYCQRGLIPSYRIGRNIRYKKSEIEQFVNGSLRFKYKRKGDII
jgi:excisionase family DNA binding protein